MADFVRVRSRRTGTRLALAYNHGVGRIIEAARQRRWRGRDCRDIPVVITSFNRLECLRLLVAWLESAGMRRVTILDNASSYPPLLAYLAASPHEVLRLETNQGPYAFWKSGVARRYQNDFHVVTDPDIVPGEGCPRDLVGHLYEVLLARPKVRRVGVGLRIDDLPDCYSLKQKVLAWESQFWREEISPGLYRAVVDTTFALYRPRTGPGDGEAVRTAPPYVAQHLPWYADSASPTDEEIYYRARVCSGGSWWSEGTDHPARDRCLRGKV